VPTKTAGRKPAAKRVAKPKSRTPDPVKTARGVARSQKSKAAEPTRTRNEYAEMNVPAIVKRLKAGETMTVIREEYGPGPKIRAALMEAGYNTKGEKVEVSEIKGSGAALAKRVARQREAGIAWYALAIATGKTETALKDLLVEHGYENLAEGRVKISESDKAVATAKGKRSNAGSIRKSRAAKTTDDDEEEKPAARRTARKTAATKPTAKRSARRVSRNPSSAA
jgi:hypothetical protein